MNNLALTLKVEGDQARARVLGEQLVNVRCRILGEEHYDTLAAMTNLAETLQAQGDLPGARNLQERVVEVRRRILGENHPDTSASEFNHLIINLQLNDSQAVVSLVKKLSWILDAHPSTLGATHQQIRRWLMELLKKP